MIPSMVKIPMIVRKSITLKSNYRNTKEIAAFADEMRLLMDLNDDDGRRTNKCVQEGKLPDVRIATSEEQEKTG